MRYKFLFFISFLLGSHLINAQNVEYVSEIDTNYILIGDQINLKLKVKADPGIQVEFEQLKDTVTKGIEIISGPKRDSIMESDGRFLIQESYVITSFDSGYYYIPPLLIRIQNENYNNTLRTDPLELIVNTFVVDLEKGNFDIIEPLGAPWTFAEILPYILWTLLGIVIVLLVVFIILRFKNKKPIFTPSVPVIPPYELAIKSLDEIKKEKLWEAGKTKEYYTQLTETIRTYIDGELDIPAMEQTSYETMQALKNNDKVSDKQKVNLSDMLETADYVKFAKAEPLPNENIRNLDLAYEFVKDTNTIVMDKLEAERKLQEEKQRELDRQRELEEQEREQENEKKES